MTHRNLFRGVALLAVVAAGAVASAQSFTWPFLMEFPDGAKSIGWSMKGGEDAVYQVLQDDGSLRYGKFLRPVTSYWSMGDMAPVKSWIQITLGSPEPVYMNIKMYSAAREATTKAHSSARLRSFTLPGGDIDVKESRGVEIEYLPASETRLLAHELAHTVQQSARKQKNWLCSQFRLRVGDLPTGNVIRTEKIKFKQEFGPTQATKKTLTASSEPWTFGDFAFYIPQSDRKAYDDERVKALDGNPTLFTVQMEYLDDAGLPLLTLRFPATIQAVGLADTLADPNDPDAKIRVELKIDQQKLDSILGLIR